MTFSAVARFGTEGNVVEHGFHLAGNTLEDLRSTCQLRDMCFLARAYCETQVEGFHMSCAPRPLSCTVREFAGSKPYNVLIVLCRT